MATIAYPNRSIDRSPAGVPARPAPMALAPAEVASVRSVTKTDTSGYLAGLSLAVGEELGRGSFHVAYTTSMEVAGRRSRAPWVALERITSAAPADVPPRDLQRERWAKAILEDEHNAAVVRAAPEVLPRYAGLAIIHPAGETFGQAERAAHLRFASMWQEKDQTFDALVLAGGLVNGAKVNGQPLTGTDVTDGLLQLTSAYRKLHARGMAYTDPKPANVAFSIHRHVVQLPDRRASDEFVAVPTATPPRFLEQARSWLSPKRMISSLRGWLSPEQVAAPAAPAPYRGTTMSSIANVTFLDPESVKRPGYAMDASVPVDRRMTPVWVNPAVLRSYNAPGLKGLQAHQTTDVYHVAAVGVGLVLGKPPHEDAYMRRILAESQRRGVKIGELPAADAKALMMSTRMANPLSSHEDERHQLDKAAQAGLIPKELSAALYDGLTGRIASLAGLQRRLEAALPSAQR